MRSLKNSPMRFVSILTGLSLISMGSFAQTLPDSETTFTIHKKEKQSFDVSLQKGYTLKARVMQMGIDLSISVYKKGDSIRLGYFDSPSGSYGPEPVLFDANATGTYTLVVESLDEDSTSQGKYSIRLLYIRIMQAKSDSSFARGSGINIGELTDLKTENLTRLGMVWGFLKYYHPSVARGDYNWDAELFRIMPKIIVAPSKTAANTELEKWVDSLGKPEICKACTAINDSLLQGSPDYGKLFDAGYMGASLVEKLTYIKNNRNQDENYYVDKIAGVGNPTFDHEKPYREMVYPDPGYRLLSLYRYWNIIQYFYPYKYVIGEDWNKILPEFIPKFATAKDTIDYTLACLEIIARVHDTHANIWGENKALMDYFGKYTAPVQGKFIENKLVVVRYFTDSPVVRDKIKIGDIITKINGRPVEDLLKNNLYLTPASNYETQLRDIPFKLLRSDKPVMELELIQNKKRQVVSVQGVKFEASIIYAEFFQDSAESSYKILEGDIGYVFPGRYHNNQLPEIEKLFTSTKGIIIDMRTYPSDFMPFTFGAYIKPAPSPFVKFTDGNIQFPGQFHYTAPISNGEMNPSYYKGPIVELVNATTQSQAEYTTMAFQTAPDYMVIGSTTAGADGNVSAIFLPGGIFTYISGIGVFYPDGTETQRKGIKIDIIVKPTIEGVKNGKDELMEKAIEIIRSKTKGK